MDHFTNGQYRSVLPQRFVYPSPRLYISTRRTWQWWGRQLQWKTWRSGRTVCSFTRVLVSVVIRDSTSIGSRALCFPSWMERGKRERLINRTSFQVRYHRENRGDDHFFLSFLFFFLSPRWPRFPVSTASSSFPCFPLRRFISLLANRPFGVCSPLRPWWEARYPVGLKGGGGCESFSASYQSHCVRARFRTKPYCLWNLGYHANGPWGPPYWETHTYRYRDSFFSITTLASRFSSRF